MKNIFLSLEFTIIFVLLTAVNCLPPDPERGDYRQEMVNFVSAIRSYAWDTLNAANFGVFPQNGEGLVDENGYLNSVDGIGREDIYYGYNGDDQQTPQNITTEIESKLDIFKNNNKLVLTIDYALTQSNIDDAYQKSQAKGYVPYVAVRELNQIFDNGYIPDSANSNDMQNWNDIKHFLYILQYPEFSNADSLIPVLSNTYYDLIVMDYSFDGTGENEFTTSQVSTLKAKPDGKQRKVLAYMSIGEAENYRYYWQSDWQVGDPDFIYEENPDWPGNYKVKYWDKEWQSIIFEYLARIVNAGFDGVYLDIIDAYEFFEKD